MMLFPKKHSNEPFFWHDCREKYYVLGASYSCYLPHKNNGVLFRSQHRELVEIIKEQLESEHAVIADTRGKSSYFLQIENVPIMRHSLRKLHRNKSRRRFPILPEEYTADFVRGFIDSRAYISEIKGCLNMILCFNKWFLTGLNKVLVRDSDVIHTPPTRNMISYGHNNLMAIQDYTYQGMDYIEEKGIYVPSVKEKYYPPEKVLSQSNPSKIACEKRIEKAKKFLLDGKKVWEVAEELGYSHSNALYKAFKNKTGKTVTEWLRENKD